jgi:hypothetical protein
MSDRKTWIVLLAFAVVLAPVAIFLLVTYDPNGDDCNCGTAPALAAHTHGAGIATTVIDNMQLIFNVSPAATLYKVTDGTLELCAGDVDDIELKHITLDVKDAGLMPGERLPVTVALTLREAESGDIVVEAGAPAMYAAGHGYHFGDNFRVPSDAVYDWTVTVSPAAAQRLAGAETLWTEPVTWSGTFTVNADGTIAEKAAGLVAIGNFADDGIHVQLSTTHAQTIYDAEGTALVTPPDSRYLVVDVTDHAVNYEEKLPGAEVTVTLARDGEMPTTYTLEPTLAPLMGFHYGANVPVTAGEWTVTVEVGGLDFMRHAGSAVTLARGTIRDEFVWVVE